MEGANKKSILATYPGQGVEDRSNHSVYAEPSNVVGRDLH